MSRRDVRTGIAEYFGGSTVDAETQIYRPTPLAASGLAGVRLYWPVIVSDQERFATVLKRCSDVPWILEAPPV